MRELLNAGMTAHAVQGGRVWRVNAARITGDPERACGWFYLPEPAALEAVRKGALHFDVDTFKPPKETTLTVLVTSSSGVSWDINVDERHLARAFALLAGVDVDLDDTADDRFVRVIVILRGAVIAQSSVTAEAHDKLATSVALEAAFLLAQRMMDDVVIGDAPAGVRDALIAFRTARVLRSSRRNSAAR